MSQPSIEPGWYPTADGTHVRWHDGVSWTDHVQETPTTADSHPDVAEVAQPTTGDGPGGIAAQEPETVESAPADDGPVDEIPLEAVLTVLDEILDSAVASGASQVSIAPTSHLLQVSLLLNGSWAKSGAYPKTLTATLVEILDSEAGQDGGFTYQRADGSTHRFLVRSGQTQHGPGCLLAAAVPEQEIASAIESTEDSTDEITDAPAMAETALPVASQPDHQAQPDLADDLADHLEDDFDAAPEPEWREAEEEAISSAVVSLPAAVSVEPPRIDPGWYLTADGAHLVWHDGTAWTDQVKPAHQDSALSTTPLDEQAANEEPNAWEEPTAGFDPFPGDIAAPGSTPEDVIPEDHALEAAPTGKAARFALLTFPGRSKRAAEPHTDDFTPGDSDHDAVLDESRARRRATSREFLVCIAASILAAVIAFVITYIVLDHLHAKPALTSGLGNHTSLVTNDASSATAPAAHL